MRIGWLLNHGEVSLWGTNRVGLVGWADRTGSTGRARPNGLDRMGSTGLLAILLARSRALPPFGSGPENEKRKNDETMEFPWQSWARVANAFHICARPGGAIDACIVGGVLRRDRI